MSPADAAKLLDLSADATPEQLEARFLELRRQLEDKIAKAPTPGLQAKYRESLAEITTAFETLTLAADTSSLPVAQRQTSARSSDVGSPLAATSPSRSAQAPTLLSKPKSGGKEFLLVAIIAVVVLAAGGWFIMKTRAENAEQARIAAEQKAEAERQAEAKKRTEEQEKFRAASVEKAERERQDRLLVQLRSRMAELNVGLEAALRSEPAAERDLNELKSQERDLRGADTLEARRLSAQLRAQERYVRWLRDFLPAHPVRIARARADELLSARAVDDAGPAVDGYAAALGQLQAELAQARPDLAAVAAAVKAPALPPAPKKTRPDGLQPTLAYLADRLHPYDESELRKVRSIILNDHLPTTLFPKLESYRSNLSKLWTDVDGQIQQYSSQEAQLRSQVRTRFANADELLRAIDGNQPLAADYLNDASIRALIMVRWQILNIREQVYQSRIYFGVPNP